MIGVNTSGRDAKGLKEVMVKEKLTWRSFADPGELGQGEIATKWCFSTTPTLYILDGKGVIRHKWLGSPGEKAIDAGLDKLIREDENREKSPTK